MQTAQPSTRLLVSSSGGQRNPSKSCSRLPAIRAPSCAVVSIAARLAPGRASGFVSRSCAVRPRKPASAAFTVCASAAAGTLELSPEPAGHGGLDIHKLLDAGLGSIVLLAATALSLYLANSALSADWLHFWHIHAGPAALGLHLSLKEWVNEGLMAIFFFVVGMDIKKEFVSGSLRSIRQALLPCLGATGGMVMPMAVYCAINATGAAGASAAGWAVPMATDIAFAMGVFGFFRSRMPAGAQAFLLTLATVDDLGAILVIALFFAKAMNFSFLAAAAALCAGLWALARRDKLDDLPTFAAAGAALWFCLLRGGINADIAGVVTAMAIPPAALERLHARLAPVTALAIMPLFALANCAVALDGSMVTRVASNPVSAGVLFGLLVGKPLGIGAASLLGVRLGWASWPTGMGPKHLLAVGLLGGIGFTMSLFLIECSFAGAAASRDIAKLAVFGASLLAAVLGAALMSTYPKVLDDGKKEQ